MRAVFWQKTIFLALIITALTAPSFGQLNLLTADTSATPNPFTDPTANPGKILLFQLEERFAKDVLEHGGSAFASWFAEDGVVLSNGVAPLTGKVAIAKASIWTPSLYQLTWTPTTAVMGPSGDMGYTWGHYEGHSKDANGNPVTTKGRYMTIWRKQANDEWKVVLDAGANEPAGADDCCRLTGAH